MVLVYKSAIIKTLIYFVNISLWLQNDNNKASRLLLQGIEKAHQLLSFESRERLC